MPHWHNGVLIGFLSKDQTGDTLMVQGQDFWVDVAIVHPKFVMASGTHICVQPSIVMKQQAFRLLSVSIQQSEFTVVPLGKKCTRITPFLILKAATTIFPADSILVTSISGSSPDMDRRFRFKP